MGNLFGQPQTPRIKPIPVLGKMSNGKTVEEMGAGMTAAEKDERRNMSENCPCPFLKTAYVQGKLDVNEVGYASLHDVYALMDWAGVGRAAFPTEGYFKKFGVTGIPITHLALIRPNDTGILHPYIGEEERQRRFERFASFANKDGLLGVDEMQNSVKHYAIKNGTTEAWIGAPTGELVTILTVFGKRVNGSIQKFLSMKDLEDLWVRSEYPDGWLERRKPEKTEFSFIDVMMGVRFGIMAVLNIFDRTNAQLPKKLTSGFVPRPNPPYSDEPGQPPMSKEEIAMIPGNYERGICLWDSRSGAMQNLAEANGGKEWDLEEHKEWWQMTP